MCKSDIQLRADTIIRRNTPTLQGGLVQGNLLSSRIVTDFKTGLSYREEVRLDEQSGRKVLHLRPMPKGANPFRDEEE